MTNVNNVNVGSKFANTAKKNEYFPVKFRLFSIYNHGKNKGKVDPASIHELTLYRYIDHENPSNTESVGFTLKAAKQMIEGTSSRITIINPGPETEPERHARYKKNDLEVVVPKTPIISSAQEAGDTTFVNTELSGVSDQTSQVAA